MSDTTKDTPAADKDTAANSKLRTGLLVSAAANIFLVAFILGRLSTPGMMPPPFMHGDFHDHGHEHGHMDDMGMPNGPQDMADRMQRPDDRAPMDDNGPRGPMNDDGPHGPMSDNGPHGTMSDNGPHGPMGDNGPHGGPMNDGGPQGPQADNGAGPQDNQMRPPPFMRDILGQEALSAPIVAETFTKLDALRTDFAQKLAAPTLSKDDVQKYFVQVDTLMDGLKKQMQQKAIDRISGMSAADRAKLSQRLMQDGNQGCDPHQPPQQDAPPQATPPDNR